MNWDGIDEDKRDEIFSYVLIVLLVNILSYGVIDWLSNIIMWSISHQIFITYEIIALWNLINIKRSL